MGDANDAVFRRVVCFRCGMITSKMREDAAVKHAQGHADATGHETQVTAVMVFRPDD